MTAWFYVDAVDSVDIVDAVSDEGKDDGTVDVVSKDIFGIDVLIDDSSEDESDKLISYSSSFQRCWHHLLLFVDLLLVDA